MIDSLFSSLVVLFPPRYVSSLLVGCGGAVIAAPIAPYAKSRAWARQACEKVGNTAEEDESRKEEEYLSRFSCAIPHCYWLIGVPVSSLLLRTAVSSKCMWTLLCQCVSIVIVRVYMSVLVQVS